MSISLTGLKKIKITLTIQPPEARGLDYPIMPILCNAKESSKIKVFLLQVVISHET